MSTIRILSLFYLFQCHLVHSATVPSSSSPTIGVYGSTVCAVAACIAASRMNTSCTIVEPRNHLWGMTSGGLSGIDLRMPIGGIANELFGNHSFPNFAPSVLNTRIWELLNQTDVQVISRVGGITRVNRDDVDSLGMITSITFETGFILSARIFLDCSYDGDLVRFSNTSYTVGREAANEYNESLGGVNGGKSWVSGADAGISPWTNEKNITFIDGVTSLPSSPHFIPGTSDTLVQTYNYRVCVTNNPNNQVPFLKPINYTPAMTTFLRRWFTLNAPLHINTTSILDLFLVRPLGNDKYDINQKDIPGLSDMPNLQTFWPLGNWSMRLDIENAHEEATRAVWEFLRNDPSVPILLRQDASTFGLPLDEFVDTAHFPPQLYVRESIRMIGSRVYSQNDVYGVKRGFSNTSIGLSQWLVDIHSEQRVALFPNLTTSGNWEVGNEGGVNTAGGAWQLTEIPYEIITPKREETLNLLVPVCASLTHVAWATYRLEPQYAIFGQSAGVAAVLTARISDTAPVQDLNITLLQNELIKQGQLIDAGAAPPPTPPARGVLSLTPCATLAAAALRQSQAPVWSYDESTGEISLFSGTLCASIYAYSNKSGAAIWAADCHASDPVQNQAFDLLPITTTTSSNGVRMQSRLSHLCISVDVGIVNASLSQKSCDSSTIWLFNTTGTGTDSATTQNSSIWELGMVAGGGEEVVNSGSTVVAGSLCVSPPTTTQ